MAKEARTKLDRIQVAILVAAGVAAFALDLWRGHMWAAGGAAGGVVAYLNFRWLRSTVERLVGEGGGKGWVAFVYLFKFALLAVVLAGLIFGMGFPALAVLVGLGAMPVGIMLESVWSSAMPPPHDRDA